MKKGFYLKLDTPKGRSAALTFFGVASFLALWSLATYSGFVEPLFLPSPTAVLRAIGNLFRDFNLLQDIWASVFRILIGFGLSVVIAIPLGIYLGMSKAAEAFLEPIISFIRYTPISALVPLFMLWLGIGETEKIFLIFAGVLPNLVMMIFDVVANARREYTEVAYSLGVGNRNILFSVILPQSLPGIWDAMRVNIGLAWTLIILAEIIAATSGLGHVIITSQRFLQTANVMGAMFIIGTLGLFTDLLFKVSYKFLFPWMTKSHA